MINAAAEVFSRKSYNGTSLQDIADAVGMQKGSLYHYIQTKDDLLFEIINSSHESVLERNVRWREIEDPLEAIRVFAEDHLRVGLDNLIFTRVYMQDFRSLSGERRKDILAKRNSYQKDLVDLIRTGVETGRMRQDLDPEIGAMAVFGMLNWLSTWYRPNGPFDPEQVVDQIAAATVAAVA